MATPSTALRRVAGIVAMALATIAAIATPPALWAHTVALDTDRYLATIAPMASDPGVQTAVIKAVNEQFAANVDVRSAAREALPGRSAVLAVPLATAASTLVNRVTTDFVQSPNFADLWVGMNRRAHPQVVSLLTGDRSVSGLIVVQNDVVYLDLAPVVVAVRERLVAAGLTLAGRVPDVGATIELGNLAGVERARTSVSWLDRAATWLPWLNFGLFAAAIGIARRRLRAGVAASLCIAGAMTALGLAMIVGRSAFIDALPGRYLDDTTAGRLFDAVVNDLRGGIRVTLISALVVACVLWLVGRSATAASLRRLAETLASPRVRQVVTQWRLPLMVAVLAVAALTLVLWQ